MSDYAAFESRLAVDRARAAIDRMRQFPNQIVTLNHPRGEAYASQIGWSGTKVVNTQGEEPMVITRLQNLSRLDVDEMVELLTDARGVKETYEEKQLPVPEVLSAGIQTLDDAIDSHRKDVLQQRLRAIAAQKSTLLSAQERRSALETEEASIKAALGMKEPTPA